MDRGQHLLLFALHVDEELSGRTRLVVELRRDRVEDAAAGKVVLPVGQRELHHRPKPSKTPAVLANAGVATSSM